MDDRTTDDILSLPGADPEDQSYRVLARKYRPSTFEDLVGQDAMVRILRAAFDTGRVAHAYMLTGVRGVGKTTTARLLARALNYTDEQGNSTPSLDFSVPGKNCRDILEGRHMDVLEMDAASRTSIDDIREIIESAKFKPAIAAYKVYIIDEVHMLSKAAFNGLLKILEEPPPHVKFIFATTEIRKVPVTILSRCQRFDLKRIEPGEMVSHLKSVCEQEGVGVEEKALALITRASEGSVRDALSLLDQAIAQGLAAGGPDAGSARQEPIGESVVRDMLGLADRERVLDLLDLLLRGDAKAALIELKSQYDLGADPLEVLRDLLELTNWLTRLSVVGDDVQDGSISETQMTRGKVMVKSLGMNILSRAWQILLKGLSEAQTAPRPFAAVEMVLVRFCYAANLPAPDELVRRLQTNDNRRQPPATDARSEDPSPQSRPAAPDSSMARIQANTTDPSGSRLDQPGETTALAPSLKYRPDSAPQTRSPELPQTFEELVSLIRARKDLHLLHDVEDHVHLVHFEPQRIEFCPAKNAPENLPGRLSQALEKWTGVRWMVSVSNDKGAMTIAQQKEQEKNALEQRLRQTPIVKAALELFPDAEIVRVEQRPVLPMRKSTTQTDGDPDEFD